MSQQEISEARREGILLVEDERDIRELIELRLRREGFEVESFASGESFLARFREGAIRPFSLAILDWMLPGISGVEIAQALRASAGPQRNSPILMVTARSEAADIVLGLESGADDYLSKPFEVVVLLARVRALLRRHRMLKEAGSQASGRTREPDTQLIGELLIDSAAHRVTCGGSVVELTPSEFKLLLALCSNRGRVLTRDQLIAAVQGEGVSVVDRAIDTHVFGLRKKLGACAGLIETVRGVGYRVAAGE